MARPESNTVTYFPHKIGDGKKIFSIETKYGNDGYATWFKILEKLATTENHYLDLNDEVEIMYLSAKCRVTEDVLFAIINDLTRLGCFDKKLWEKKYIWSQVFIDSIQDAYSRRINKCMTLDSLCKHLQGLCSTETELLSEKPDINTQSKVKERKVEKSKVEFVVASLTPQQSKEVYNSVKESFLLEYATRFETEYYFIGKDGAKVQSIIKKVVFKMKEKDGTKNLTQEEITINTNVFLKATLKIADNWLTSNFSLSNIDSKFNEIYSQLKSKASGKQLTNNTKRSAFAD